MANDNNNNPLVSADDDPTAELEALALTSSDLTEDLEAAATTTGYKQRHASRDFEADVATDAGMPVLSRSDAVDRLQFDLEVMRAKWQGLTTEIAAREDQANRLNQELLSLKKQAQHQQNLVQQRDATITALEQDVEGRDQAYQALSEELATLQQRTAATPDSGREELLAVQAGQLASDELEIRELRAHVSQLEEYADQLRYQLRVRDADSGNFAGQCDSLEEQLRSANERADTLERELAASDATNTQLTAELASIKADHSEEIERIRFELGDAQETLTQHELVTEQLASDLVENRSVREDLEARLAGAEREKQAHIEKLQGDNRQLATQIEELGEQLRSKSEAVTSLLAELAKSQQPAAPKEEIEDVIQDLDDRVGEQYEDSVGTDRDRITRLLVGRIGQQDLRFPLFKNRLTIGRTRQNDIQLKSEHISRRHAVVVTEGDVTRVIDWGSKNGVFVNAKRVKEHFLQNGDVLGVGNARFRYQERPKRDA